MTRQLARLAPGLDIVETSRADSARRLASVVHRTHQAEDDNDGPGPGGATPGRWPAVWPSRWPPLPLLDVFDLANIVLLFLLGVVLVAGEARAWAGSAGGLPERRGV